MKPIFLIGYMASGKTTFGRALASATGQRFIDLDEYIVEKTGLSIPEIFSLHGEDHFRKLEREMLQEVTRLENVLVACGGGTPCFFDNIDIMNDAGITVWLDASISVLKNRLMADSDNRPLVKGKGEKELEETIKIQLERRVPYYKRSQIKWNSDLLENETQIKENVERFINNFATFKPF